MDGNHRIPIPSADRSTMFCIYQVLANIDEHPDLDITLVTRASFERLSLGVQCAASVVFGSFSLH